MFLLYTLQSFISSYLDLCSSPTPYLLIASPCLFFICSGLSATFFPLTQCSVSCGGGVQTRTMQCLLQGRPAAGCLPHQRPITSRACNTHFCSAAPPAPAQRLSNRITAAGSTPKGEVLEGKRQIHLTSVCTSCLCQSFKLSLMKSSRKSRQILF